MSHAAAGDSIPAMSTPGVVVIKEPPPCSLAELRRRVVPLLQEAGVQRAIVFGSWARSEADGFSDLDLVVVMNSDLPRVERGFELARRLDEALPVVVDLLVYTPTEFATGQTRGLGVFDLLKRDGLVLF